ARAGLRDAVRRRSAPGPGRAGDHHVRLTAADGGRGGAAALTPCPPAAHCTALHPAAPLCTSPTRLRYRRRSEVDPADLRSPAVPPMGREAGAQPLTEPIRAPLTK